MICRLLSFLRHDLDYPRSYDREEETASRRTSRPQGILQGPRVPREGCTRNAEKNWCRSNLRRETPTSDQVPVRPWNQTLPVVRGGYHRLNDRPKEVQRPGNTNSNGPSPPHPERGTA